MTKRTPGLTTKAGRHYFRLRVPLELVKHIGKIEISQALGDVSKAQAATLALKLSEQWSAHFLKEKHRLGLTANPPAEPIRASLPRREATLEEAKALAQLARHSMLSTDDEARALGALPAFPADPLFLSGRKSLEAAVKDAISGQDVTGVRMQAEECMGPANTS